jgi:hypothetical protein
MADLLRRGQTACARGRARFDFAHRPEQRRGTARPTIRGLERKSRCEDFSSCQQYLRGLRGRQSLNTEVARMLRALGVEA